MPGHDPDHPSDDETRVHRLPPPAAWPRQTGAPRRPPAATETRTWTVEVQPTQRISVPGAAPRRKLRDRRWVRVAAGTLVTLAVVGVAAVVGVRSYDPPPEDDDGDVATDTPNVKHPPPRDVTLETCKITRAGAEVTGTVRNPTDDPADYVISVDLLDPDGIRITGNDIAVDGVAAESRTEWSGLLPAMASTAERATCKVVQVDRYRVR